MEALLMNPKEKFRRQFTFLSDRRISGDETQRRYTWFTEKSARPDVATRPRGRILREITFPENFRGLYSARFSPDGSVIATAYGGGAIQVREASTGELKGTLRSAMDQAPPVMCVRFDPIRQDTFYAASACGSVFLCSLRGEFHRYIYEDKNEINTLDVNVPAEVLATGGKDAAIRTYDTETGKIISLFRRPSLDFMDDVVLRFHRMRIFAIRFHPQSKDIMISGGWDDTVKIWDIRIGSGCVRAINGPHICGDAIDIKERVILTGSWAVSGCLQLWDMDSGKLIDTVIPVNRPTALEGEFLYATQFFDGDPYGDMVMCGGSGMNVVEILSLKQKRVLGSFRAYKAVQAIDSYGQFLCYGGMESVMRLGDFA